MHDILVPLCCTNILECAPLNLHLQKRLAYLFLAPWFMPYKMAISTKQLPFLPLLSSFSSTNNWAVTPLSPAARTPTLRSTRYLRAPQRFQNQHPGFRGPTLRALEASKRSCEAFRDAATTRTTYDLRTRSSPSAGVATKRMSWVLRYYRCFWSNPKLYRKARRPSCTARTTTPVAEWQQSC